MTRTEKILTGCLISVCALFLICGGIVAIAYFRAVPKAMQQIARHDPPTDFPKLRFLRKKSDGPIVVFVHGLAGDGDTTWKNDNGTYWPQIVANDDVFEDASVAVYYYDTTIFSDKIGLDQHARQMTEVLKENEIQDRTLLFVCHSMGGLVVRRNLLAQDSGVKDVQGLCFYGTPFTGADLADAGTAVSDNLTIQQLMNEKSVHNWLDEQQSQWIESKNTNIPAWGYYETEKDTLGLVVDEASLTAGCNRKSLPVTGCNHRTMVKPDSADALAHRYLRNAFIATTLKLGKQTVKKWPDEAYCKQLIADQSVSENEILNPTEKRAGGKHEVVVTIHNGTRRNVCLVICDASRLYQKVSNSLGSPFQGIDLNTRFGRQQGTYFDGYRNSEPTGWFLLFVRYRDDNGDVQDQPCGVHFLSGTVEPYIEISRTLDASKPYALNVQRTTPPAKDGE